jgi:hypothetical protein
MDEEKKIVQEKKWIRLWLNGSPKDCHHVTVGFIERLKLYMQKHPAADIVIEYL